MGGWQHIESAPTDGTRILGYEPGKQRGQDGEGIICVCWLKLDPKRRWQSTGADHGWYFFESNPEEDYSLMFSPEYWKPLGDLPCEVD